MTAFSRHMARTYSHLFSFAPEEIFPLLCPTREYDWIPHWSCELVHSVSGFAERDCVFVTRFPTQGREVWLQTRHELNRAVEFARIGAERTMRYSIELLPAPGGAAMCVTQRMTYIGDDVEARKAADDRLFTEEMPGLMALVERYLSRGAVPGGE